MTYKEAMARLDGAKTFGSILGLETMGRLMEKLGEPQKKLKFVHIAGTNGKGSTAAYISSMLRAGGYRTGLYISPFVQRFSERIQVDGENISEDEIAEHMTAVARAADEISAEGRQTPTVFELVTAIGLLHFVKKGCDIVVFEVGLGGRLDATNIIDAPVLAVMTHIGFDHTELLGDTIGKIAAEKAGIIKKGSRVIVYGQEAEAMDVFSARCWELDCPMYVADASGAELRSISVDGLEFDWEGYKSLRTSLTGLHQIANAVTAVKAAEALGEMGWGLDEESIRRGLLEASCIGRLELLSRRPLFLVDGAHNPQGVAALAESLRAMFPGRRLRLIAGMLADKEHRESMELIAPLGKAFYTITPPNPRALSAERLAEELMDIAAVTARAFGSAAEAIDAAVSEGGEDDIYCAFGSLYQIADIRNYWKEKK